MNIKTLIAGACIALVLAACAGQDPTVDAASAPAPAPAPASTAPDATAGQARPAAPTQARYAGFETVEVCVQAGWPKAQCERAWGTADAMTRVDAPSYAGMAECQAKWKSCASGQEGKIVPVMAAFAVAGEEKGEQGPSKDNPAFYIPIFITSEGKWVYLTGTPENPVLNSIDEQKVARAQSAPAG